MSHRPRPFAVGLALAVSASTASAQIFSGVDVGGGVGGPRGNSDAAHARWVAAAAPLCAPTETFEGIALGTGAPINLACGMRLTRAGGPAPTGAFPFLNEVTNNQDAQIGYNTTAGGERYFRFSPDFGGQASLTISFAQTTTAFGVYVTGIQHPFGITTATWGANNFVLPDTDAGGGVAGVQFFGFVDAVGVNSVTFTTAASPGVRDIMGFDDLQVNTAPEPGTVALTLSGLLAFAGVARRRRHV